MELPEEGYVKMVPALGNELLLGVAIVTLLFLSTLPWAQLFTLITPLLPVDGWVLLGVVLILIYRLVTASMVDFIGGASNQGNATSQKSRLFFYDVAGEMVVTALLCSLVLLKNPIVLLFIGMLFWSRLRVPLSDESHLWPEEP